MNHRAVPVLFIAFLASFALVSIPAAAQQSCESLDVYQDPERHDHFSQSRQPGI